MYWVTALILVIYLVLVWLLGKFLPLHGSDVWILRGVLALLGLVGAGVAFWYQHKIKRARAAEEGSPDSAASDDLDLLVREAARRLKQSTLGRGTNLASLPLIFLLGDSASTKTTVLIHSALDPELLAGQVYRDTEILPTSSANLWYTRQAIFVDPAGSLMGQGARWKRLVKLVQPGRLSAAVGRRAQAPRAALVCFDCETFLRPGASETTVSAARRLSSRLQEISHVLGISIPVYVLFTKLDRVSFFTEFARQMTKDEAAEVLGATLPLRSLGVGIYADEETRRLTKAFDEIFYSLADRRTQLLPRERESNKLPAIYEFPREIRKLRTLLVQFLVDLARPSHLSTNPFLRGFYFTGVRPVVVDDVMVAVPAPAEAGEPEFDAGATRIFSGVGSQVAHAPAAVAAGSRRMPNWVFLTGFFNDVLLKDRVALAASRSSSHVSLLRRIALGAAIVAGVICLVGFSVSFLRNRALEAGVRDAVADLRTLQSATNQVASVVDLQRLDRLRDELVTLGDYDENGAPWSMRWGLYVGDQVYPDAKRFYFQRFRQLLFAETQNRLIEDLRSLPDKPGPNDVYETTYSELKAYLITTSNHDKSTKEFLSPVLMNHWIAKRDIDNDRKTLANSQFDYYSTELARENPFPPTNFPGAVLQARSYLQQFAGIDRFYLGLLAKAAQNNRDLSFNEQFPESVGVIVSTHKVKGAFTRNGFAQAQEALKNPSIYLSGEEWVLGKTMASEIDPTVLRQKLSDRYNGDFVAEWRTVLQTSAVAGYRDFNDANKKLEKLTSQTSPLLELFWFISHNTAVDVPAVSEPFLPVQGVEPPGPPDKFPDAYKLPSNNEYIQALAKLQSDIDALARSAAGAADPTLSNQALTTAGAAKVAATAAVGTRVDQKFHNENLVRLLLEEPITSAESLLARAPGDQLAGSGKAFCSQFAGLTQKFPLRSDSPQDLSIDELNAMFAPGTGQLWKFYNDAKLANFMTKQGSRYVASSAGSVKISLTFQFFFNRAAGVSDALYPGGAPPPHFSYTLKQMPSNLEGVVLQIGNEALKSAGEQKTFVWTGAPENIQVTTKNGDVLDSVPSGPWAVFHFFSRAKQIGSGNLEWVSENNGAPVILPNGKIKSYVYALQVPAGNPFFDLPGLKCAPPVGH